MKSAPTKIGLFSFDKWLLAALLLTTVMVSALAMSPNVADPDLWGHVQFGRDVMDARAIPETNGFSFTADSYRWINHENLSEIILAWTVDHFGNQGLLWGKFALSLLVIGALLIFNLRSGVGVVPSCILTILVAWNLGYHWSFRPQLSSFVYFTLLILLIQVSFKGWRGRWCLPFIKSKFLTRSDGQQEVDYSSFRMRLLWLAPVIFLLWANSHGGYVAGLGVFIAYLGCRTIEILSVRWPQGWGYARRLGLMALVAILATLVNPYSFRLPMWLFESLGEPRPEILDWSSDQLFGLVGLKFWVLILIVIGSICGSKKSLDFTQCVLLTITLWQAISHFRHVPFFAILAGFWIGPHLKSFLGRFQSSEDRDFELANLRTRLATIAMVVLLVGVLGYRLTDRLTHLRVERDVFPVDAFNYMGQHQLGGRLVVTYDWAQYAIGAFGVEGQLPEGQPLTTVAFDGRFRTCYPQQIVDMHFDLLFGDQAERHRSPESPPIDPARVLEYGAPNLVLIRRHGELSGEVMKTQAENWVLLYEDRLAQLWGRRSVYDDPEDQSYIAPEERIRSDKKLNGYVEWPALPRTSIDITSTP